MHTQVALLFVAFMLQHDRIPDDARLLDWVRSRWFDALALYLRPLTTDSAASTPLWRAHARHVLTLTVQAPWQAAQPILCYMAALPNQEVALRLWVAAGADCNMAGAEGTALHCAIKAGHAGDVRALRDVGADITARDPDGYTPEDLAARQMNLR